MRQNRKPEGFRPFAGLKELIHKKKPASSHKTRPQTSPTTPSTPERNPDTPQNDSDFLTAVADITPITSNKVPSRSEGKAPDRKKSDERHASLEKIILEGGGFTITDIPEYLEGTGYNIDPKITKRLRRGDFSIQDHIDLHGMNRQDAKEAFDGFLNETIRTGKRMVLIIHGRGLSSPVKPVLKSKVSEWLSSGIWRKWVLAFSSARAVDGGAGATYVLLRKNPATKKQRKGKKIRIHQEFSSK